MAAVSYSVEYHWSLIKPKWSMKGIVSDVDSPLGKLVLKMKGWWSIFETGKYEHYVIVVEYTHTDWVENKFIVSSMLTSTNFIILRYYKNKETVRTRIEYCIQKMHKMYFRRMYMICSITGSLMVCDVSYRRAVWLDSNDDRPIWSNYYMVLFIVKAK